MKRRLFRLPGGRERIREDVDEEVRYHLERKVEKLVAQGLDREEAEREAARRFGDVDDVKEAMEAMSRRRMRRQGMADARDGWAKDVVYAGRQLRRNPVFAAVAVLTLALGIGVNTAIFSVVDGILFRPLPFPEPEELVTVWSDVTRRGGPANEWLSWANYEDLATRSRTLESLAAWSGAGPTWTDPETPEQILGGQVSWPMFRDVLRVDPELGRAFTEADHAPDAPATVILSHGFWERAFGGDPGVLGRTMTLNGESTEIVGVMPAGFRPPFVPAAELWLPTRVDAASRAPMRGNFSWRAVGRVTDGVAVTTADADLRRLGERLEAEYPDSNTDMTFTAVALRDDLVDEARTGLLVLLGAVGLVLLVACVNVANLLLVRAIGRRSELAVRSALGAGHGRLVRQLLTESVVLAVVGGAAGVILAWVGTDALVALAPDGTPRIDDVTLDGRVLAFTAALTMLSGLAFGLLPALRVAGADLHDTLREGGRGQLGTSGTRLRNGLVVGQVAVALVLLVGAGLLLKSFRNLTTADLGFEPAGVTSFQVNLFGGGYDDRESLVLFVDELEERLAALPGVRSAGVTSTVPLTGFDGDVTFFVEGRPVPDPGDTDATWFRRVTPGYLPTMGIDVVQGRNFTDADGPGDAPVVIVNETLAARFFPDESPVGKRITFSDPRDPDATWRTVVGVARDIRNFGIREGSRFATYSPWDQTPGRAVFPMLEIEGPVQPVIDAARREVAEMDPGLAVAQVRAMREIVRGEVAPDRFVASLLAMFAAVGLVLALVGLYGVVSYGVSARVREMGVRMALGAGRGRISGMVLLRSLALVGVGLVVGLGGAWVLSGLVENLLFGVSPTDPVVVLAVSALLALAATVASLVPALRATRVDPSRALREG